MNRLITSCICLLLLFSSCKKDPNHPDDDPMSNESLTHIPYSPTSLTLTVPNNLELPFPPIEIPLDNPMTEEAVELGRRLFYDPILSADSTMSCFSCHLQDFVFADGKATSEGIDNIAGKRSAMPLINMVWNFNGFFWDGRAATLEEQALLPVEDELELHDTWENVLAKLNRHDNYPQLFRKAFGIERKDEITRELAAKALAQFQRTIIVGRSRFDRAKNREVFLTDEELNGMNMYFGGMNDIVPLPDAQCFHCHGGPLLTANEYKNNGLQEAATLNDFEDKGKGGISGIPAEMGLFRTPTLRNIELSAPYMHDGSIATLEEVIDHYNSGGHYSPNKDNFVLPLQLDSIQKTELLAFLKTLTDYSLEGNSAFENPF